MPLAKSKKSLDLGNALMNDRFGKSKGADRKKASAITRTNHTTGEQYVVNERQYASWVKMRSVTEQGPLDEFLATAQLAGTDFTAERMKNVKIIHTDQKNPYLLSAREENDVMDKQKMHKARLSVPRRPHWDASTTPQVLDARERKSFLDWRRSLAELQENHDLLMTPFERNIEVWRQLWRVIERSDLIVQIVDARNPLLFRSEDLGLYVKEVDAKKENLLLINKADMMTLRQRKSWATYLKKVGIAFRFFSAHLAKESIEAREDDSDSKETPASRTAKKNKCISQPSERAGDDTDDKLYPHDDEETRILTVEELEGVFLKHAPAEEETNSKLQVGLVGYPNVGKSSTINALIGAKKVSVSSTPGKTKHFQTIHLSERVILCDCPGLVFPNFAFTKADLVCNGVLPIDQLREYTGPVSLVTQRIPKRFLEAVYGINIMTRPLEEGGTGSPTASELLRAYATARGFQTQGLGQPDESRAARYILKDYVNGKLLFVHPPPDIDDAKAFNQEIYEDYNHQAALMPTIQSISLEDDNSIAVGSGTIVLPPGPKTEKLDAEFFSHASTKDHTSMSNFEYTEEGGLINDADGNPLSDREARMMIALEHGLDPDEVQIVSSKKHFKGGPKGGRKKNRRVKLAG